MATNNTPTKTAFTVGGSLIGEGIINYKETNNMNTNNNASQTLFRFVSLRNPQLTETKERNLGFIHRPKGATGIFDTAVAGKSSRASKLREMVKVARNFSNAGFETEKKIEEGAFGRLLKIGRQVSRKEELENDDWSYVKDYYNSLIDNNKELTADGIKIFSTLWNNYIFQIVTQGDFYVKEAISHVLMAIHIGFAQNMDLTDPEIVKVNGEKPLEKALDGKIVLPKFLFSEDGVTAGSVSSRAASGRSADVLSAKTTQRLESEARSLLIANKALHKKEALEKLTVELEKLQKKYHKSSYQTYQDEYAKYQEGNREALEAYERKLAEIESKITEETSEEEKIRLYEELRQYEVKPFEFSYKNEINLGELMEKLSPESFDNFIKLFAEFDEERASEDAIKEGIQILSDNTLRIGSQTIVLDDEVQTYSDALNIIGNNISSSIQTAMQNSPLVQQQYVNIGGASVPVVQNTARTPMAYSFFGHSSFGILAAGGFVNFSFEVEDTSWSVANAKIIATTDTAGSFEENFSNIPVVNDKITLPTSLINKFRTSIAFRIEIIFDNGSFAYADLGQQYTKGDLSLTGMLTLKRAAIENPEEPETVTIQKRKNFGIKRLGVADYLKVVQSVHAYVPGEVSNIENVMASELRHKSSVSRDYSEITDTTSKSEETEKISDTTKTSRTDMQTEVAKELDKDQSITAHTRYSYGAGKTVFEIGAEYANNTAQHDSTRQAVMKSQEITERAMERVLTKISEERVQKIIKEYTETNVHEFDNRGKVTKTDNADAAQPKHITGVYRWIDKKMKNQIYNYGIRTMFEFMVPEPSRLHRLAVAVSKAQVLTAPVDPRTTPERAWTMPDPKSATVEQIQHWAQIYGVNLSDLPPINKTVSDTRSGGNDGVFDYSVPANYACYSFDGRVHYERSKGWHNAKIWVYHPTNSSTIYYNSSPDGPIGASGFSLENSVKIPYNGNYLNSVSINLNLHCKLSDAFIQNWKTENFNAIIKAYEAAYVKFQEEQARLDEEQKAKEAEAKERQGNFYRYMEHDTLKHNCIAYLLQDYLTTLGQETTNALNDNTKMDNFQVYLNDNLDQYAALAKFMEQAFEWEIMDYTFYPYYWANRKSWQEFYLTESMDPLFRSFLQAGMARIIVTVKPGFEAAVQFFLETGIIWNGGAVPVIGDPMYMSIVDEMRQPTGKPQGKYWITRVPTTLTILQASSTGLPVEHPLPIFPEDDPKNCENPKELEFETSFSLDEEAQLAHSDGPTTLPSTIIKPV
ncbi:uncharacterized protein YukE [Chryseobacterium ginsenosidimutans]|uniref:hypothetical protein n=1 Tax=Chryseobacterium ginsenosidimutans TaxID=687846 RepID=UPI00278B36C3|nr:hypothetical protein [Chryseobacterium ginsenosidimutans]MDQ0593197.1 uncharacterized protein YukE [Chryseobacterium ginsenosidimutans]